MLQCDIILTHHILRSLSYCLFQLRPSMTARPNDGETTCRVRFCLDFGAAKQEVFVFLRLSEVCEPHRLHYSFVRV